MGKATSLKNRVRQYFQEGHRGESPRRQWLVDSIADLEYFILNSPLEALILEADLIKRHRPYFNVRMKDDKRYPCIEITIHEDYPRMRIVRRPDNRHSRYFGPYTDTRAMRRVFKLIQKAFMVRTCKYDLLKLLSRPCLDYHINLCTAPCVGNITREDYRKMVDRACSFLDGRGSSLLQSLKHDLEERSKNLEFERCVLLRDMISSVEHVLSSSPLVTKPGDDGDYLGAVVDEEMAVVVLIQVRDGRTIGQQRYLLEAPENAPPAQVLERFITGHYRKGFFVPPKVYTSMPPANGDFLSEWLSGIRERKVKIITPQRGQKKKITGIALENAREHIKTRGMTFKQKRERNRLALESLEQLLGLPNIPQRIEGYDISNISGTLTVGSMVVFLMGEPYNAHYRQFRVRSVTGPDDFASMEEVLERRLKNLQLGELESFRERPDLILIDGGRGQLNAALSAARKTGLENLNFISIAKREEEIFMPHRHDPVLMDLSDPALQLLQRVRDESHRFAVTYHRKLRKSSMELSILDGIPGVSKKRKETLLRHFDNIDQMKNAGLYELQELPGFNRKVAEAVLRYLGSGGD